MQKVNKQINCQKKTGFNQVKLDQKKLNTQNQSVENKMVPLNIAVKSSMLSYRTRSTLW